MMYIVNLYKLNGNSSTDNWATANIWENVVKDARSARTSGDIFESDTLHAIYSILGQYGAKFKTYNTGGAYAEFETVEQYMAFVLRYS